MTARTIIIGLLLALTPAALAEPLPHPKTGQCSGGYVQSGGYCIPKTQDSAPAVPKPPGASCPSGWRQSGSTCERMAPALGSHATRAELLRAAARACEWRSGPPPF
jgi:hypothetical protein